MLALDAVAGQQAVEKEDFAQRHLDREDQVAETVGNVVAGGEGNQVVEVNGHGAMEGVMRVGTSGCGAVEAGAVGAPVQRDVALAGSGLAPEHVLAEFVQKVELHIHIVVVVTTVQFVFDVAHPGGRSETSQWFAVIAGQQAEAAFHPAFEHCAFDGAGIEGPAVEQAQVVRAEAALAVLVVVELMQAEPHVHFLLKQQGALCRVGLLSQLRKQAGMPGAYARYAQPGRVGVVVNAAEPFRRDADKIAAIHDDRKPVPIGSS